MVKQWPISRMIGSNQRVATFQPFSWQLIWQLLNKSELVDQLRTLEDRNGVTDDVNADVNADVNGQVKSGL